MMKKNFSSGGTYVGVQADQHDEESSDYAPQGLKAAVKKPDSTCSFLDALTKIGILIIFGFILGRLYFLETKFESLPARDVGFADKPQSLSTQALEESILTFTKEVKRVVESQETYTEALQESILNLTMDLKSESTREVQLEQTSQSLPPISLEELMYKYGSDKSKDDHGYTNIYQLLFNPIQYKVKRVLEIGIAAGQSLQGWREYFPNAQITGVEPRGLAPKVKQNIDRMSRVNYAIVNVLEKSITQDQIKKKLNADLDSFDIIIDDGPHTFDSQRDFLVRLFPFVKPGGIYIIEDITPHSTDVFRDPNKPAHTEELNDVLTGNDCSYVDTTIGHRDFKAWHKRWPSYARDRSHHNSNMIVIRKRDSPLHDIFINSAHRIAMNIDRIVQHEEENDSVS